MRTINYSCVALLLAAACGSEQAACPGESSDNIACTADICDQATNQWVHVPDNGACGSAQVCTLTGCADSALTGTVHLFGHDPADAAHDDSGVTVTLLQAGASGSAAGSAATVTTAADGTWSIGAEPGAYAVQYTKAGYFTVTTPSVVAGVGGGVAPTVTLSRSQRFNDSTFQDFVYDLEYTPSDTAVVNIGYNGYHLVAYVTPLDGSHGTVTITIPTTSPTVGDDSLLWTQGNSVWSVPLDGSSPPCVVGTAIGNGGATGSISIVGTPKTYVVIEKTDPVTGLQSLWTAKTDCSVPPPTTAAWTQPDPQHTIAEIINDDQTTLFFTSDESASPPNDIATATNAHRIDFATNTLAAVHWSDSSYIANDYDEFEPSPDGKHLYGAAYPYFQNNPTGPDYDDRGFMADITAASLDTPISLAPFLGSGGPNVDQESDWGDLVTWAADSSGVAYTTNSYLLATSASVGGNLRYWKVGSATAVDVALSGTYSEGPALTFFGDNLLGYFDATNNYYVGVVDGTTLHQLVDSSGSGVIDVSSTGTNVFVPASYVDPTSGTAYLWWEEPPGFGGTLPTVAKSAVITPSPLSATVTTLGSAIGSDCAFQSAHSDEYFYELCSNTGTITAFPPSSATASGQFTGALAPLYAVPGANAIAFQEQDGRIWGASNGSTFGPDSLYLVASTVDSETIDEMAFVGKWLVYYDPAMEITRVSNVSQGGVIDEPVSSCDGTIYTTPTMDNAGSNLWFPAAECVTNGDSDYRTFMTPTANLP